MLCSWRVAGQHPPAPEESWHTASATKGAPQAASTGDEDFQVSRLTATSTRVLQDSAEEVSDRYSFLASPGKGGFRSLNHAVPIFKGNLQNDPGNCTVIGLISVLDKAGEKLIQSSPDKEGLQGQHS